MSDGEACCDTDTQGDERPLRAVGSSQQKQIRASRTIACALLLHKDRSAMQMLAVQNKWVKVLCLGTGNQTRVHAVTDATCARKVSLQL